MRSGSDPRRPERHYVSPQRAAAANPDRTPTHFLGAFVVEPYQSRNRFTCLQLIDGQQRLTTLQVLIAAVRGAARYLEATQIDRLLGAMLHNPEELLSDGDVAGRHKVWPSKPDRDEYRQALLPVLPEVRGDGSLLHQARRYFDTEVSRWLHETHEPLARLEALVTALRERLSLVEIVLGPVDDAQVIFETLNSLGTELRAADLVKNMLFRALELSPAPVDLQDVYDRLWSQFDRAEWKEEVVTGRIRRARVDILLSYWVAIQTLDEVLADSLFIGFRAWYSAAQPEPHQVLESIAAHALAYDELAALPANDPVGRLRRILKELDLSVVDILLVHMQTRRGISAQQRAVAAAAIESFLLRRLAAGLPTGDYNRLFLQTVGVVAGVSDDVFGDAVREHLASSNARTRRWPDDVEVAQGLRRQNLAQVVRGARLRVLLGALEARLSAHTEFPTHPAAAKDLTIEHLLPQSWQEHYPLLAMSASELEDRENAVHSLGNITLLRESLNKRLSNARWETKRGILAQSALTAMTRFTVLEPPPSVPADLRARWEEGWDEERINARRDYLIQTALNAWPRPR